MCCNKTTQQKQQRNWQLQKKASVSFKFKTNIQQFKDFIILVWRKHKTYCTSTDFYWSINFKITFRDEPHKEKSPFNSVPFSSLVFESWNEPIKQTHTVSSLSTNSSFHLKSNHTRCPIAAQRQTDWFMSPCLFSSKCMLFTFYSVLIYK